MKSREEEFQMEDQRQELYDSEVRDMIQKEEDAPLTLRLFNKFNQKGASNDMSMLKKTIIP